MKILLSNDDGQYSPCLDILISELSLKHEVITLVPSDERSTTGHGMNLTKPLLLEKKHENFYTIDGLPADCALLGINLFKPDLVISGINLGGNLGQDIFYSGTVAVAREARFRGVNSFSFSLTTEFSGKKGRTSKEDFINGVKFVTIFVENFPQKLWHRDYIFNINFPFGEFSGIAVTKLGFREYNLDYQHVEGPRHKDFYFMGGKYLGFRSFNGESDCEAINDNKISITPLSLTSNYQYPYLEDLKNFVSGLPLR